MNLDEIIAKRRSIRRYKPEPVEEAALTSVLEAGRLAPSANNAQRWTFTVVKREEMRQQLAQACFGQRMVEQAPVTLVIWAEEDRLMSCGLSAAEVDCSIALSFMMLKAAELGLGTCWLGAFDPEAVKNALGLPQQAEVIAVTPLGYPDEEPTPRPRKALAEIVQVLE